MTSEWAGASTSCTGTYKLKVFKCGKTGVLGRVRGLTRFTDKGPYYREVYGYEYVSYCVIFKSYIIASLL
jgi:hypothetical protein